MSVNMTTSSFYPPRNAADYSSYYPASSYPSANYPAANFPSSGSTSPAPAYPELAMAALANKDAFGVNPMAAPGSSRVLGPSAFAQTRFKKAMVANGTPAYCLQMPGARKSAVVLSFPIAALPTGSADLLMALLKGGSPSAKRQREEWERQGIQLDIGQSPTFCTVQVEAPAGQEAAMLAALDSVLARPVVDPATFNTLKSQYVMGEKSRMKDAPWLLENRMAQRLFGPNHPYGRTAESWISDYSAQTLPGVMAHQPALLQLIQQGQAMMISPLSGETQQQLLHATLTRLGGASAPLKAASRSLPPEIMSPAGSTRKVLLPVESAQQGIIKVLWQAPDVRDPDYPAFALMTQLLMGESTSSFFKTLRTRDDLLYGMKRGTSAYQFSQGEAFSVGAEVDFSKIAKTLDDIREVTQGICRGSVSAEELQAAQRIKLLGMRRDAQTAGGVGAQYACWLSQKGANVPSLEEMQAAFSRVTPADIQRVANRVFNNPNNLSLLGVAAPLPVLQQVFPGEPLEA